MIQGICYSKQGVLLGKRKVLIRKTQDPQKKLQKRLRVSKKDVPLH